MRLFLFGDVVVRCGSVPVNDAKTPHETKLSSRKSPPPLHLELLCGGCCGVALN